MSESKKDTLSERDLSYNVALAGATAKAEAADLGGDPAQLRSLVAAAREETGSPHITLKGTASMLKGQLLRQDDLLVTLCINLYKEVFRADPSHQIAGLEVVEKTSAEGAIIRAMVKVTPTPMSEAGKMQAIAALGYIFTSAEDAWEWLDRATDASSDDDDRKYGKREFLRAALEFSGSFSQSDIDTLLSHVAKLMRRNPAEEETAPGKPDSPAS